jgi:hypothetical protein
MIAWLASWPRSGNTFIRALMFDCLGIHTASKYGVDERMIPIVSPEQWTGEWTIAWAKMADDEQLHLVKTHEPPEDSNRAIYIVRDGRAACDSYAAFLRDLEGRQVDLLEVIAGSCSYGSWSAHLDAWNPMTRPGTLLVRYEDLLAHPMAEVERIAAFLDVPVRAPWRRDFADFRSAMPGFFKEGCNDAHLGRFGLIETALFWTLHAEWMQRLYGESGGRTSDLVDLCRRLILPLVERNRTMEEICRSRATVIANLEAACAERLAVIQRLDGELRRRSPI